VAIDIQKYSPAQIEATVTILADAFVTNPLHVCAFGPERLDQNRLFFRIGLRRMFSGQSFVALSDGEVRGYVHFNASPYCLPPPEEVPLSTANLLKPLGAAVPQVIKWVSRWCRLDPEEPHGHLGPIGVSPQAQGQGVGTALMGRYLEYLERERLAGYLETDRPNNVGFYEKFGFVVRREEMLIGTPVWYMWRTQPS
jgi:ribosomal protein S18 acetylase RimI-like enzyme